MATLNLGRTLTRTAITPTTSPLLRRLRLRRAALPLGLGLGLGLTTGLVAVHHQRPMQFDSLAVPVPSQTRSLASGRSPKRKDLLDAETVKQLSSGSLSGIYTPTPPPFSKSRNSWFLFSRFYFFSSYSFIHSFVSPFLRSVSEAD
ncbi:hypothetical protein L209DRAFT_751081 [Thermothelomyces heterothallicus CBS 203.75]